MKSRRVKDIEAYRNPLAAEWGRETVEQVKMAATPMAMQPTAYIRNSRANMPHGQVSELQVASVHDGETLALALSWEGVAPPGRDFPDAVAVTFPVRGNPILMLMGSKNDPMHILQWKAGKGVRSLLANGIGLSDKGPELKIASRAEEDGKRWRVVITRVLGQGGNVAPVVPGHETKIGFAVWSGINDERAGLKSFSLDWIPFAVDA